MMYACRRVSNAGKVHALKRPKRRNALKRRMRRIPFTVPQRYNEENYNIMGRKELFYDT